MKFFGNSEKGYVFSFCFAEIMCSTRHLAIINVNMTYLNKFFFPERKYEEINFFCFVFYIIILYLIKINKRLKSFFLL